MTDGTPKTKRTGPRRGGPYPRLRVPADRLHAESLAVWEAVATAGSIRGAAALLGMSATTAWRRYWWLVDFELPERRGVKRGQLPPMRGTRACPRGRPYQQVIDGPPKPARPNRKA